MLSITVIVVAVLWSFEAALFVRWNQLMQASAKRQNISLAHSGAFKVGVAMTVFFALLNVLVVTK
jgi:uncharacterized membrane protein YidH (DUF202 family)